MNLNVLINFFLFLIFFTNFFKFVSSVSPVVVSVTPDAGPLTGGTALLLAGTDFTEGTFALFLNFVFFSIVFPTSKRSLCV